MTRAMAQWILLALWAPGMANATTPLQVVPRDPAHVRLVAYGDQRFTETSERDASRPAARQALVRAIAEEPVDAVLMTGDVPWHGGTVNDYLVYETETALWRERHLNVFPALGNHEFAGCAEADCLAHWWEASPHLAGLRWYRLQLGPRVEAIALDSTKPFNAGSEQRQWLERQVAELPPTTAYVVFFLHHPPVAARESDPLRHNVRPNEVVLADYLTEQARHARAKFIVVSGHIHNYERREQGGVVYLVSGGGGAKPYPVSREGDLYASPGEPNFHYVTFDFTAAGATVRMHRLEDPESPLPHEWKIRDQFEIAAPDQR